MPQVDNPNEGGSEKELKYLEEIKRLKSFLLQLDEQITEETQFSKEKIEGLEAALAKRDDLVAELQSRLDVDSEALVEQFEEENDHLKAMISSQEKTLIEVKTERDNLNMALEMLQANLQEEISTQLLSSKQKNQLTKQRLVEAERKIAELEKPRDEEKVDDGLTKKLVQDLDVQNHLIDQLNNEINFLKRQMQAMIRGDDCREGYVDKHYIRSVILSLARPPSGVTRLEIWSVLVKALGISEDEAELLGIKGKRLTNVPSSPNQADFRQDLSDVWISFLLHETQETIQNRK